MRDLFYFTQEKLTFIDIKSIAAENGYTCDFISDEASETLIYYADDQYWRMIKVSDLDFYEEVNKNRLKEMSPQGRFQIEYLSYSSSLLKDFLRCFLQNFGGWIGLNDDWETIYDLSNLNQLEL